MDGRYDAHYKGTIIPPWSTPTPLWWICTECDGLEPVKYDALVHDSVIVSDPSKQLDQHDCDLERVRQIMES